MEIQAAQQDPDVSVRTGAWLFRHRTWLPLPIAAALLILPPASRGGGDWLRSLGGVVVLAGEALRLWAVHHIGVISRTRSERLGPLISSGPFALVRNPLYIGNIALWCGFALSAGQIRLALPVAAILALEYHAIVRWEEGLLASRIGAPYREYLARVPRWLPLMPSGSPRSATEVAPVRPPQVAFSWRETLFSERGTLIAIAAGYGVLWLKSRL